MKYSLRDMQLYLVLTVKTAKILCLTDTTQRELTYAALSSTGTEFLNKQTNASHKQNHITSTKSYLADNWQATNI